MFFFIDLKYKIFKNSKAPPNVFKLCTEINQPENLNANKKKGLSKNHFQILQVI